MKILKYILSAIFMLPLLSHGDGGIDGYWLVPDDDNDGAIQGAALLYEYNGAYYCRMVAIIDENTGAVSETVEKPTTLAKGIDGNPPICGMDFIWELKFQPQNNRYLGKVIDPDTGKIYKCEVWFDSDRKSLVVRGEFLIFGKNEYWSPATEKHVSQTARLDPKKITPKKVFPKKD